MGNDGHETTSDDRLSATHDFAIRNYSRTKGVGVGAAMLSNKFTVDGREWRLRVYPDGYGFFDWRDLGLFVETVRTPFVAFHAYFAFHLLNARDGGKVVHGRSGVAKFDHTAFTWGVRRFISRRQLEAAELGALHDDAITVRCTVSVLKPDARVMVPPAPPSCFAENAVRFLASGRAPFDVRFSVDGVVLEAHRLVLASQSPWFDKLLYGHWSETTSSSGDVVQIRGTSPEVFKAVLHYIYNDQLPEEDESMTRQLFVAADMYLLDRLKKMCARRLCDFIVNDTVESIMEFAEWHSCEELTHACRDYIVRSGLHHI